MCRSNNNRRWQEELASSYSSQLYTSDLSYPLLPDNHIHFRIPFRAPSPVIKQLRYKGRGRTSNAMCSSKKAQHVHALQHMLTLPKCPFTSRACCTCLVGPTVTLQLLCLFVCWYVCHSLGRPGSESMADSWQRFELAGLLDSSLQKEVK